MKKTPPATVDAIKKCREQEGLTLSELTAKFDIPKATLFNIIRDCDASKVRMAAPNRRVVTDTTPKERPLLSKVDLGEAARQIICARLMFAGKKVFRPMTEDTPVDLLILSVGKIVRCQCKYLYPTRQGCHVLNTYSVRRNRSTTTKHTYTKEDIDFLLGYCQDDDAVYVIPIDVVGRNTQQLRLWILRPPAGRNDKTQLEAGMWKNSFNMLD